MLPFYQIRPKDFSVNHNLKEISFNPHIHKDIEILYMRGGKQKIFIEEKEYIVKKGEAAIIFPEIIHEYSRERIEEADEIIIIFSPAFYRAYFPDLSGKAPVNPVFAHDALHPDAVYALETIERGDDFNAQIANAIMIMTRMLNYMTLTKNTRVYEKDMPLKIIEYVGSHFTQPISVGGVADELHISKSYVSKIFSEKLHTGFRRYLGIIRAEYAAGLLRATDDKVITISEKSGFDSLRTFNRTFREIYNMSPAEFRRNINKYMKI